MPRPRLAHLRHDAFRSASRRALLLMLLAAAAAPAVTRSGAPAGGGLPTPFALPTLHWRLLVAASGIGYLVWWLRREPARRALPALAAMSVAFWLLATTFAIVADARSTMFYTADVLEDGMAVLLGLYATSALLRAIARADEWETRRLSPATWFADDVTTLACGALVGFWIFSAVGLYSAAGLLLLLGGAGGALLLPLRLPDALSAIVESISGRRGSRRTRRRSHGTRPHPGGST